MEALNFVSSLGLVSELPMMAYCLICFKLVASSLEYQKTRNSLVCKLCLLCAPDECLCSPRVLMSLPTLIHDIARLRVTVLPVLFR